MEEKVVLEKVAKKRSYLKFLFKDTYEKWVDKYNDDRGLFCMIYTQLNEMLDDLEKCRNIGMFVAYNGYEQHEREKMSEIMERFKNMEKKGEL